MPDAAWSNGPGAVYAPHAHPYHKALSCERGSIEFRIHDAAGGRRVRLRAGDSLEIPPGTIHSAIVGPDGVECSEIHRHAA